MKLTELADYLMGVSGQFVLGSLEETGLNIEKLWYILKPEFENWQRFCPLTKHFNIYSTGLHTYDFTYDSNNVGYTPAIAETLTTTKTLNPASSQSFTLTLPNAPLVPQTIVIQYSSEDVATDDGFGNLVFSDDYPATYSGTVNYTAGTILIDVGVITETTVLDITVNCNYTQMGCIPRFIQSVVPCNTIQLISLIATYVSQYMRGDRLSSPDRLLEPRIFKWVYKYPDPVLRITEAGQMDVVAHYNFQVIVTKDEAGKITEVEIPCIEDNDNYYVLLQLWSAKFLEALGRSRRAFTYDPIQITSDAVELVREGQDKYKEALALLYSRHDWSAVIRG